MNIYNTIKATVTTRQAAEHFGLTVDKHGMAVCPFHDDHQPSLKLDQRYYCFGCHATGDVIDFTARLHGISNRAAAEKISRNFRRISETAYATPYSQIRCRVVPGKGAILHSCFVGVFTAAAVLETPVRTGISGGHLR